VVRLFRLLAHTWLWLLAAIVFLSGVVIILIEGFPKYRAKLSQTESIGELGPHWIGKQFRYVGEFYRNYVYVIGREDGCLGTRLAGDQCSADIYSVREDTQILFRDPRSGRFAVFDPSDQDSRPTKSTDLKFESALGESIPRKAWQRATNPKDYLDNLKKGRQQDWIYVDSLVEPRQSDSIYVGTTVKSDSESGYSFVPLLVVNQQRITFYLDPKNRRFAPVAADAFGTPLEDKLKYQDMKENGVAEAVWKTIRDQLLPESTSLIRDQKSPEFKAAVEKSKARAIRRYPECANPNSQFSKKMVEIADRLEKEGNDLIYQADSPERIADMAASETEGPSEAVSRIPSKYEPANAALGGVMP
jgi:hypothetical protein